MDDKLWEDPRIVEAKKLIFNCIQEKQVAIKGIRPPDPEKEKLYKEVVDAFGQYRGIKLWYPYIGKGIGNGPLVELVDGSVKYDFISGIGVHYFGHSNLDIINATLNGAISNTVMQGYLQQNIESYELVKLLIDSSGLDHCVLSSSGVMANENALKIAFHKKCPAQRVLAFKHCFAGRTLTFANITDKPSFRKGLPNYCHVDYIPFSDWSHPEESIKEAQTVLKEHLSRYPGQHAAMIFELVQGEAGAYPGTREFFLPLMQILKEHNIAIFIDEVQTFGRTHRLFAYQHFNLQDYVDIVSIGKLSQICATLYRKELLPEEGLISQTFTGSSTSIFAAQAIIEKLLNEGFYGEKGKNAVIHEHFKKKLIALADKYPGTIQGPFGIGSMIAFTALNGEYQKVKEFSHTLYSEGVMSFIGGTDPARIRFLVPAGAVNFDDIDRVVEIIEKCLLKG